MTFLELEHPRADTGRFIERARSAPEMTLAPVDTRADAVARNDDIFHPSRTSERHSKAVTVGTLGRARARVALVWHEDQDRFIVDAWWDSPQRPSRYVHVRDLAFDDPRAGELAELIQSESGATADVVDEFASFIRSRA